MAARRPPSDEGQTSVGSPRPDPPRLACEACGYDFTTGALPRSAPGAGAGAGAGAAATGSEGASAPQALVDGVVEQLRAWGGEVVVESRGREENVIFSLPRALQ